MAHYAFVRGWPLSLLCVFASLVGSGCSLIGGSPVTKQVATCRQLSQRGMTAIERGQWSTAESLLAQAIKSCPVDANAQRHYAETLWQRGAQQEAMLHAEQALRLSGDDPHIAVRVGEMNLTMGRLNEALALANTAIDADPTLPSAWALRGRVEQIDGLPDAALADFHRALQYAPNDRRLLLETAELYRVLNRPQRALATLATLRETYPSGEEPARLIMLEGMAMAAQGRHADAIEAYTVATAREPASAELLSQLAQAQLAIGRTTDAVRAVQQALAIEPAHPAGRAIWQQIESTRELRIARP